MLGVGKHRWDEPAPIYLEEPRYEFTFVPVNHSQVDRVRQLCATGWEPVPDVAQVTVPPGAVATASVFVFLRRRIPDAAS